MKYCFDCGIQVDDRSFGRCRKCAGKVRRVSPLRRFDSKVSKSGSCWNWTGTINRRYGYGMFSILGRWYRAHRVSYERYCGEIPNGKVVCHSCDNRACVNPDHLFIGTQADNIRDAVKKGRMLRGSKNPASKIEEKDVIAIRSRFKNGETQTDLAREYKLSQSYVSQIVRRLRWGWLE